MPETAWEKTKKASGNAYSKALKPGFDKAWLALDKLGAPANRLSNKLGAEAFWPTTLDKESDKAARILRSFCKDGFYEGVDPAQTKEAAPKGETLEGPQGRQRVLKKIPEKIIKDAKGLAIFTTMRTGLWISGAGGSGVLVARNQDTGEWSPPSGIMLHTAGLGFLAGVDIYDCVVVLNTNRALEAFTKLRCTLGGEVSAAAGPLSLGGVVESEVHKRQAPVWTYLKSRGCYVGVQIDGTIVIERTDENERFYGERIPVADILAGKARYPAKQQYQLLSNTLRAAQGEIMDEKLLPPAGAPTPGDQEIEVETNTFGIPDSEDPDPYGVKALQTQGIHIRDASTQERPSAEVFEFKPSPTSPVYSNFTRKSLDSAGHHTRDSWRMSVQSTAMSDRGTQTDGESGKVTPVLSPVSNNISNNVSRQHSPVKETMDHVSGASGDENEDEDRDSHYADHSGTSTPDEDVEIHEAQTVVAQAKVVTIPKRLTPSLPPRNPQRMSSPVKETEESLSAALDEIALHGDEPKVNGTVDSDVNGSAPVEEQFHSIPSSPVKEAQKQLA